MHTLPTIRDAESGDLDTLVDTLSDSFSDDPILNWVFPRKKLRPDFFRLVVKDVYLPRGIMHMEATGRAAALWLPPEERFEIPPRMALLKFVFQLLLYRGPGILWRIHQQHAVFAKHLPKDPHYYLQFIGCRQRDQGQGIGAALLKKGTSICDERGMPAYLESSNIINVPLYERHGFEVIAEEAVARNGPKAWFMWREPQ